MKGLQLLLSSDEFIYGVSSGNVVLFKDALNELNAISNNTLKMEKTDSLLYKSESIDLNTELGGKILELRKQCPFMVFELLLGIAKGTMTTQEYLKNLKSGPDFAEIEYEGSYYNAEILINEMPYPSMSIKLFDDPNATIENLIAVRDEPEFKTLLASYLSPNLLENVPHRKRGLRCDFEYQFIHPKLLTKILGSRIKWWDDYDTKLVRLQQMLIDNPDFDVSAEAREMFGGMLTKIDSLIIIQGRLVSSEFLHHNIGSLMRVVSRVVCFPVEISNTMNVFKHLLREVDVTAIERSFLSEFNLDSIYFWPIRKRYHESLEVRNELERIYPELNSEIMDNVYFILTGPRNRLFPKERYDEVVQHCIQDYLDHSDPRWKPTENSEPPRFDGSKYYWNVVRDREYSKESTKDPLEVRFVVELAFHWSSALDERNNEMFNYIIDVDKHTKKFSQIKPSNYSEIQLYDALKNNNSLLIKENDMIVFEPGAKLNFKVKEKCVWLTPDYLNNDTVAKWGFVVKDTAWLVHVPEHVREFLESQFDFYVRE